MPLFEYACAKCDRQFEVLVFGAKPKVKCPACGGGRVRKLPSVFGLKSGSTFVSSVGGGKACCAAGGCGSCAATG